MQAVNHTKRLSQYLSAIVGLLVFAAPSLAEATVLSEKAQGLKAGGWARIESGEDVGHILQLSGNLKGSNNSNVLEYASKGCYSARHKVLMFAGGPHTGKSGFILYDERANRWRTWPDLVNPWADIGRDTGFGHSYSLNTCSQLDGRLYLGMGYVSTAWQKVRRYDTSKGTWDASIPDLSGTKIIPNVAHAMEFFPDFGSKGTLFYLSGNTGKSSKCDMGDGAGSRPCYYAAYLDVASNEWKGVLGPIPVINKANKETRAIMSLYSSQCRCIFWGGGGKDDRVWMKIWVDSSNTMKMTRVADLPVPMTTRFTLAAEDPNTDQLVVFSDPENQGYLKDAPLTKWTFDISDNKWTRDAGFSTTGTIFEKPDPTMSKTNEVIMMPIAPYGVVGLVEYTLKGSKPWGSFWIYKPSKGTPVAANFSEDNTEPPPPPAPEPPPAPAPTPPPASNATAEPPAGGGAGSTGGSSLSADQDFASRCAAAGVVVCYGFDTQGSVDQYQLINTKIDRSSCEHTELSYNPCGWVDPNIKTSGSGALRFEFPSNSSSGIPGQFPMNFSGSPHRGSPTKGPGPFNVLYGQGDTFYVSWRQRMDDAFLHPFKANGGGGFKQIIISAGDRDNFTAGSCTILEIVQQNVNTRGFPAWYDACSGPNPFAPFQKHVGNSIHVKQNFGDYYSAPTCDSRNHKTSSTPNKYPPDDPPCFSYHKHVNQWVSYQIKVQIGTWGKKDSEVAIWAAGPNDSDWTLIHRESNLQLDNNSPSVLQYGKVWLLPFITGKDSSESHAPAHTWYDELIVSTSHIRAPNGKPSGSHDTTPPQDPTGFLVE